MSSNNSDNAWAGFKLWYYAPSIPAAAVFCAIFILLTCFHTYKLFRSRNWFCIPFVVGGLFEAIGYITRAVAHNSPKSTTIYAIQSLLLLLAPILFAASIYMVLGRLVRSLHAEHHSVIRINWLTKIFVGSDIFCFAIQGGGGGLLSVAKTKTAVDRGNNIILGGLILQILIFLVFVTVAIVFQTRLTRSPTAASTTGPLAGPVWKKAMIGLYVMSALITTRNVYRVVEYVMGNGSYLQAHEWSLYVFDGLLMILVLAVGVMWYGMDIKQTIGSTNRILQTEDGYNTPETVLQTHQPKHEQTRPWS